MAVLNKCNMLGVLILATISIFTPVVDCSFQNLRTVGFTARRTNSLTAGDEAIGNFNDILTNHGDSFDPLSGTFNCVIPGTYLFWLDFHASSAASLFETKVELVHNDDRVLNVVRAIDDAKSSTGSAILDLQYNDKVYLRLADETRLESSRNKPLTFTGFILNRY